ncbi:hypothetical protein LFAB_13925 [Lactiplantibacillus fabifermentans T30PCM01]|uniref:Uncharacterized protein n=1 Tax=Lactiplantibacillus fabifermentans T30PCM01 TaxID=1400520 RepID=W6TBS5_9LACO|nr:hypothetical protein LFAB_13925 [Lactiplantibacillus fabifermentans T30PCM01]
MYLGDWRFAVLLIGFLAIIGAGIYLFVLLVNFLRHH